MTTTILEVKGLESRFYTRDREVKSGNGLFHRLDRSETFVRRGARSRLYCGRTTTESEERHE